MKLILKTNIDDSLLCKVDNKDYKNINLKKNCKIILPDSAKKVEIIHSNPKKKNIIGFIIMSIVCFFLESQKTIEKREFISFYEFAKNSLISDFYFETNSQSKKEISIFLKEQDFGKFKCYFWVSDDIQIQNQIPKKELKQSLIELISFWFTILTIPILIFMSIVIASYINSSSIFDLGIFLIFFLFCVFFINIICFIFQYRKILNCLNSQK